MKKILFIVCENEFSPIGERLYQENPYGQTDVVEWLILNMKNCNLSKDAKKELQDKFDCIYNISQTQDIGSRTNEDFINIPFHMKKLIKECKYVNTQNVNISTNNKIHNSDKHSIFQNAINIIYQKTYSAYDDYDRVMTDFENIIHQEEQGECTKSKKGEGSLFF